MAKSDVAKVKKSSPGASRSPPTQSPADAGKLKKRKKPDDVALTGTSQEATAKAGKAKKQKSSPSAPAAFVAPAVPEGCPIDGEQVAKAVRALLGHIAHESAGLLDGAPPIHVLMSTKQMPKAVGKAKKDKPVPLQLPHPFTSLDSAEICLITKDPQREFKDKLAAQGLTAKVIGVSKLKKKYGLYEAKRQLMAAYDTFLADERVLPILPPLLGKHFFAKRRLPTPVNLKKQDLRAELQRAVCATMFRHATGTSNSFQVGTAEQSNQQIAENIVAAVLQVVQRTPGQWKNLQSLNLRTTNSVALPFYNALPHA